VVLLIGKSHRKLLELRGRVLRPDLLGRLIDPHDCRCVPESLEAGMVVAADNLAFSGFDEERYVRMLARLEGLAVSWVALPDVVGNARTTLELAQRWLPVLASHGLPAAFVAQDGLDPSDIPPSVSCVFLGGTDRYKLGPGGRAAVAEARERGLAVHVGRVNSVKRIAYAGRLGADTIDGSGFSKFTEEKIREGVVAACGAWWVL
jgi:hypothetical protein